ncbi:MAG: SCO family protein [Trueperaceae bacterium]
MNQTHPTARAATGPRRATRLLALLLAGLLTMALTACGSEPTQDTAASSGHAADHAAHAHEHAAAADTAAAQAHVHAAHTADEHAAHTADEHAAHTADEHAAHEHHEALGAAPLPGTSIYHLATDFTDHHQRALALPDLRGEPSVFVMFYGDCTTACPLLVRTAEQIEESLPDDLAGRTQFVMVSFDTERDTPDNLLAYAQDKGLDKENWHWLVGSPLQTRQLATLLGVQFRDAGNGVFAHSNLVTVVDPDGVPSARLEGIVVELEPAIAAITAAGAVSN